MLAHRRERVGGFIFEEITLLLHNAVRDPRVQALTVTNVDLTPDRRIARIYVACYSGEEALQEGLKGLESAKGYLRHELGQLLHWRFTPELEFRVDHSWEEGNKIDALLGPIRQERDEQVDHDTQPE